MEMPIQIMIVLFVALLVGGVIVSFSQNNFEDSAQKLEDISEFNEDGSQDDKILEMNEVNSRTVASLADQCFRDNQDSIESTTCFVILGEITAQCDDVFDYMTLEEGNGLCDISSTATAVKIDYNSALFQVEVKG